MVLNRREDAGVGFTRVVPGGDCSQLELCEIPVLRVHQEVHFQDSIARKFELPVVDFDDFLSS